MKITGERVVSPTGGFNPTWQRHVAAYVLCEPFLGPGRVLDLGCGVGHSYHRLAPRETVGVDLDSEALEGQERDTVVADMRALPFDDASFSSVVAVQSIEHVPDPERAVAEAARVLERDGAAVFVTPNRLTLGRPEEIIDPYHYVEFDPDELRDLCAQRFGEVEMRGLVGSDAYMELFRRGAHKARQAAALGPRTAAAAGAAEDPPVALRPTLAALPTGWRILAPRRSAWATSSFEATTSRRPSTSVQSVAPRWSRRGPERRFCR